MQVNAVRTAPPIAMPEVDAPAPPLGTSPPPLPPSERLEPLIGECMAAAASVLLRDMLEYDAGQRPAWSGGRTEGGDRLAELYELRQVSLATGELYAPFEQVARVADVILLRR